MDEQPEVYETYDEARERVLEAASEASAERHVANQDARAAEETTKNAVLDMMAFWSDRQHHALLHDDPPAFRDQVQTDWEEAKKRASRKAAAKVEAMEPEDRGSKTVEQAAKDGSKGLRDHRRMFQDYLQQWKFDRSVALSNATRDSKVILTLNQRAYNLAALRVSNTRSSKKQKTVGIHPENESIIVEVGKDYKETYEGIVTRDWAPNEDTDPKPTDFIPITPDKTKDNPNPESVEFRVAKMQTGKLYRTSEAQASWSAYMSKVAKTAIRVIGDEFVPEDCKIRDTPPRTKKS